MSNDNPMQCDGVDFGGNWKRCKNNPVEYWVRVEPSFHWVKRISLCAECARFYWIQTVYSKHSFKQATLQEWVCHCVQEE
jgi:hypothetical protein